MGGVPGGDAPTPGSLARRGAPLSEFVRWQLSSHASPAVSPHARARVRCLPGALETLKPPSFRAKPGRGMSLEANLINAAFQLQRL